jgi:hypothetical protein
MNIVLVFHSKTTVLKKLKNHHTKKKNLHTKKKNPHTKIENLHNKKSHARFDKKPRKHLLHYIIMFSLLCTKFKKFKKNLHKNLHSTQQLQHSSGGVSINNGVARVVGYGRVRSSELVCFCCNSFVFPF